jgi:WD40 repeat protein
VAPLPAGQAVGRAAHDLHTEVEAAAGSGTGVLAASTGAGIGIGAINPTTGEVAVSERKPPRVVVPASSSRSGSNPLASPTANSAPTRATSSAASSSYYVYTSSSGGPAPATSSSASSSADPAALDTDSPDVAASASQDGGSAGTGSGGGTNSTTHPTAGSARWNGVPTTLRFRTPSQAHESWITAIAWLPLSNRVAVASMDRAIVFYDPSDLDVSKYEVATSRIRQLSHTPLCLDATQSSDGKRELLAVGDDGGNLTLFQFHDRLWHVCDGLGGLKCRHDASSASLSTSSSASTSATSSSSAPTAASATTSTLSITGGGAFLWSSGVTRSMASRLHTDWITSVKFDARLDCLITGSLDARIQQVLVDKPLDSVRDPVKKKGMANEPLVFTEHREGIYCFDYIPKSRWMASGGLERNILIWNAYTNDLVHTLTGHSAPVHYLTVDSALGLLITCDVLHTIKIWDLRNDLQCVQTIDASQYSSANNSSAERLAGGAGLSAGLNVSGGAMPGRNSARTRTAAARRRGLSSGAATGGGAGAGGAAGSVASHALAALNSGRSLSSSYQAPPALYYNQARHQLLMGSTTVQRYDLHELRLSRSSHARPIVGVLYNPNFQSALSADERVVSVWDVATGQSVFRFDTGAESGAGAGHEGADGSGSQSTSAPPAITAVSFDHGKMRLVTGATDGRLRLWNFSKGSKLYVIVCRELFVVRCAADVRCMLFGSCFFLPAHIFALCDRCCSAEFVQQFEKPSASSSSSSSSTKPSAKQQSAAASAAAAIERYQRRTRLEATASNSPYKQRSGVTSALSTTAPLLMPPSSPSPSSSLRGSAAAVLHSSAVGGGESAPSKSAVELELEAEEEARAVELQRKSGGGGAGAGGDNALGIRQPYISGILYVELPEAKVRYAIAAGWDRTVTGQSSASCNCSFSFLFFSDSIGFSHPYYSVARSARQKRRRRTAPHLACDGRRLQRLSALSSTSFCSFFFFRRYLWSLRRCSRALPHRRHPVCGPMPWHYADGDRQCRRLDLCVEL